jgi:arsenite methyltransferase
MSDLKEAVRQKYAGLARSGKSCCDPITSNLYGAEEVAAVPEESMRASLGCGNPTMLAQLHPGETVLDLGSGGGVDVLLSARRVAPAGKVYGLDMTDAMLELARENQRKASVSNVEFLRGEMENIPLPDNSVDVIISNCVINLSVDKPRVLREAFRVLKPGGRFAVSDVVARRKVPAVIKKSMEMWIGCVGGALEERQYRDYLANAGFEQIDIEPTREFRFGFMSAFVRARKPA